jgi:predicted exporter
LLSTLYNFFSRHRAATAVVVILLAAFSWLSLYRSPLATDVAALLPDRGSRAAADFKLLSQAPLTRRLLVNLKAAEGTSRKTLLAATDRLAAKLHPPLFRRVITGPKIDPANPDLVAIGYQWANLMTAADLDEVSRKITPAAVNQALDEARQKLLQPLSFLQKDLIRADPLNFRSLIYAKLRSLNPIGGSDFAGGHFLSRDGRNSLLIIETPVEITDYKGSERLIRALDEAIAATVPGTIRATAISGHFYTVANARAIKADMLKVISASLLALGLIYLIFLRSRRGLLVFFLPLGVVGPALALTAAIQGSISAITVGFGAVLLGVTIDYALHPYFALAAAPDRISTKKLVANLSPPIIGAGATTIGAFSTQLFSSLPGQRQLALFAIIGVLLALSTALLILPHFLRRKKAESETQAGAGDSGRTSDKTLKKAPSPIIIIVWIVLLTACGWSAGKLKYAGDLRQLNLVPEKLRQTESDFHVTWGGVRNRALIFTTGPDRQAARASNDRLYEGLRQHFTATDIVSLAPVLPAVSTQTENRQRWHRFWNQERKKSLVDELLSIGERYGFSPAAFQPFFANLTRERPFLNEDYWRGCGLSSLFDALEKTTPTGFSILSLAPDRPKIIAGLKQNEKFAASTFVSPGLFNHEVGRVIARELKRSVVLALLVVTLILLFWLRRPFQVFLALLPVLSGLLTMFGIMGALGYSFNLFNLVATILMIGLGVDYGIFMVYRLYRDLDPSAEKAVLVSALTTLSGFGVLVLARHPALHSIGLTILLGVCGALPVVLWILPALARLLPQKPQQQ